MALRECLARRLKCLAKSENANATAIIAGHAIASFPMRNSLVADMPVTSVANAADWVLTNLRIGKLYGIWSDV
jgi:hypothetical protein